MTWAEGGGDRYACNAGIFFKSQNQLMAQAKTNI